MNILNNKIDSISKSLILISISGLILSFIIAFANGGDEFAFFHRIGDWSTTLALALFINWILTKFNIKASKFAYLLLIPSIINSFNPAINSLENLNLNFYYTIISIIYYLINIYVVYKIYVLIKNKKIDLFNESENDIIETKKQKTLLDKVIISIEERVSISSKRVFFSLIAMIVIVIVGSSASFGTVALNEANKIRELEAERIKMLTTTRLLKNTSDEKLNEKLTEIKKLIEDRYGKNNDYKVLISNIEKESYISWPDIAMRITIAALTLFLVQIFFHIYKYNQRQESSLLTKIELFKLFTDEKAQLDDLRNGLISKVNSEIEFEKSPSSPTEQIINVIGKSKE
ncbi:hypothetical protein [Psychroserpens ponticola]|uniref:DUF4407 domain-containing protein n=1 Tax=Psychroserpens ponticola TaxID=2932268 RepID=A0ABY7S2C9_9FLAO|nr:hypothetical protein [Psychroserpens ponticola]WCO03554.1 hypothetical protein MUN68_008605 [Psychroserpens ponticola]